LKPGLLMRALYGLESFAYKKAARVSGIMPGMINAYRKKGVPASKLVLFPNGVVLPDLSKAPARGAFRARNGFASDDFLAVYSGNLGVKQGLDVLVEAARTIQDRKVRVVICGEGAQREHLARMVQQYGLRNVTMLPLQGDAEYREMLVDADVCVITQQPGSGGFFFPSKLLTTLAWQKPVLTVADRESELVAALEQGGFGVNITPGDAVGVAEALRQLATDRSKLAAFGTAGRAYVAQFEMSRVLAEFTAELETVCAGPFAASQSIKVAPAA
jgi:colanic acid biosynthesis glycosyl transferase WcaI